MKKHILMAALPLMALSACGDSNNAAPVEEAAVVDLAAGTGPYIVTYADGTEGLFYSAADGTEVGGPMEPVEGGGTVKWSVVDGRVCIDLPAEDAVDFCLNSSEIGPDGSWTFVSDQAEDGAEPATIRRIDMVAATPADQTSAGSYMVDLADGNTALAVWAVDGNAYLAMNPGHATWRAVDGQRCGKTGDEAEETCSTPGEMGADGTFTVTDVPNGPITVRML